MLNKYKNESFNNKHNVLLIAHSQGNLFANKMYELLTDKEKEKFAMVSVATPAGTVAKGGGYTTLHDDWVIKGIPNSLSSNADGSGHSFVESYLNNPVYESVEAIATNIRDAVDSLDVNSCTKYLYFRWIGYMCPSRQSTELEVDIYGSKVINSNGWTTEDLITSDTRQRVPLQNDVCPLQGWDYRTDVSEYNKNGCLAYTFTDTSGYGMESNVAWVYNNQYQNRYTCTTYNMNLDVAIKLNDMQE